MRGADINSVNLQGKTALTVFIEQKRIPIIEFLLRAGADPHIEDMTRRDACDYAELNDIYMFSELKNCNPNNRKRSQIGERKTLEQAAATVMKEVKDVVINSALTEEEQKNMAIPDAQSHTFYGQNTEQKPNSEAKLDEKLTEMKKEQDQLIRDRLEKGEKLKVDLQKTYELLEKNDPLQAKQIEHERDLVEQEFKRKAEVNELMRQRRLAANTRVKQK